MRFFEFMRSGDLLGRRIEGFKVRGSYNYQTVPGSLLSGLMRLLVLVYMGIQMLILINREDTQFQNTQEIGHFT